MKFGPEAQTSSLGQQPPRAGWKPRRDEPNLGTGSVPSAGRLSGLALHSTVVSGSTESDRPGQDWPIYQDRTDSWAETRLLVPPASHRKETDDGVSDHAVSAQPMTLVRRLEDVKTAFGLIP